MEGINLFKHIQRSVEQFSNAAVLTGYELELSKKLKQG
jgi:hypothetical protein